MIEEADYIVRMTFTTTISFSPIERDTPLSKLDAVGNAQGTLPDDWFKRAEAEGWSVEFAAERIS
jgi:hypothetical protein